MASQHSFPFPSMSPYPPDFTQGMMGSSNSGIMGINTVSVPSNGNYTNNGVAGGFHAGGDNSLLHHNLLNNDTSSLSGSSSSFDFNDPDLDIYTLLIMAGGAGGNVIDPEDQDYMNKLTHYLMGIGGSIVCCLGTIANAMSVAVLTRPVMKSSTYMYLAALAVCDSLVLFFTLLLVLKDTRPPDSPHQLDTFHAILYPFVHPTAIVFQVTSIWLTLAFTVDRYIMICHPFKAEHMCRKSRARRVVVGIYVGGFLFNIPKYLENYTKTDEFKIANSTHVYKTYGVMTTEIGNNELFRKIVHSWGYLIFVCGIPFLTLVVLNAFLIRAVRESRLKGKEINPKEKHRNDTTIMLIGVIIIFLICQGPALASRMTYAFKPGTTRNRAYFTLNEVASFLVILNSAINIVPYYLFGRKFRSEFWRIFCACFMDKDEIRRIARSYSVSMDHRRLSNYNVMEMNGMGQGKSKNDILRASNNAIHHQRCGTGTTNTASYNSNLYDETSPNYGHGNISKNGSFGDIKLNDGGGGGGFGGSGGGFSGSGGGESGQYLALPLIHNSHNSSPSSPSYTADLVAEASKIDFNDETSNLSVAGVGGSNAKQHPHDGGSPSLSTASLYNYLTNLSSDLHSQRSNSSTSYFTTGETQSVHDGGAGGGGCIDMELNLNHASSGGGSGNTICCSGSGSGSVVVGGNDGSRECDIIDISSSSNDNSNNTTSSPLLHPSSSQSHLHHHHHNNNNESSPTTTTSSPSPSSHHTADYHYTPPTTTTPCTDITANKHRNSLDTSHKIKRNSVKPTGIQECKNYHPLPLPPPPPPPSSQQQQQPSSSSSLLLSPSLSSSSSSPSSPTLYYNNNHPTNPASPSITTTNYLKSSPGPDSNRKMMKDALVSGNSKGANSNHHGKYMSLATTPTNTNIGPNNKSTL